MDKKKVKDRFAENKDIIISDFQKREDVSRLTFGLIEVTLTRHRPHKEYVCYICDRNIEDFYYSRKRSGSVYNEKVCPKCIAKFIYYFNIDLDKWNRIINKRLKRMVEIEEYLKAHEMD
jgi:hypothetical protein